MTPEEKILEKIRKILMVDPALIAYVKTRVYASHPSTILEPKFPAISLHMLTSGVDPNNHTYIRTTIQIDAWLPMSDYDGSDLFSIHKRLRALLHKQDLTDTIIPITVASILEIGNGPMMTEKDTGLLHYPSRYEVVVS